MALWTKFDRVLYMYNININAKVQRNFLWNKCTLQEETEQFSIF
jgi:hypothetical protein